MKKEKKLKSNKTLTGQDKDIEVNISPVIKEATSKSAVITFGRMNPPTIGHLALVQAMLKAARSERATPLIFLSHSEDAKKNPLSYDTKLRLAQAAFGKRLVVKSNARTIIEVLKQLQRTFSNVTMVVGSDRVPEFERLLKTYNGRDFKFDSIKVLSAGTRDPDSEGVSGMSASKMRELAVKKDLNKFKSGLPPQLKSMADMVMTMIRTGMNLQEELEKEGLLQERGVLTLAQRRKKALVLRRYKNRMKIARARQQRRMADSGRLKKRAARAAIRLVRKRIAGSKGQKYTSLTAAEKSVIDKRVRQRSALIGKLAKRLLPTVRRSEMTRLKQYRSRKANEELINAKFENYLSETQAVVNVNTINEVAMIVDKFLFSIEKNNIISEKAFTNIVKKSKESGAPIDSLVEVYTESYHNPKEGQDPEQSAFLAINKFVTEGAKKGLWDNIHAKRKRIESGSGETMRKPGSKGAPTKQDFRDASEATEVVRRADQKAIKKRMPDGTLKFVKEPRKEVKVQVEDINSMFEEYEVSHDEKRKRKALELEATSTAQRVDSKQEKEKKSLEIRHARQDASAKIRDLRMKTEDVRDVSYKRDGHDVQIKRHVGKDSAGRDSFSYSAHVGDKDLGTHSTQKKASSAVAKHLMKVGPKNVNEMFTQLDELYWEVDVDGLPKMYVDSTSAGKIKVGLRKLLKKPEDTIRSIVRKTPSDVRKIFRAKAQGKELTDEPVDEVLKKSDDMGKWIDDFQKSDAPQFKGKSKEKKRQMAIAAKLSTEATVNTADIEKKKHISQSDKDKLSMLRDLMAKQKKPVKEEHGAGFIGTDGLRKKYEKETPGQGKAPLAVDGVPTKDGIKKPKV